MIRLEDVTTDCFTSVSFELKEGIYKLILSSDYEKEILWQIISGGMKPQGGKVYLLGTDIYSVLEKEFLKLVKRIGLVRQDGGVISNLKTWENIMLPLRYHMGKRPSDVEPLVIELFSKVGISGDYLTELIGRLSGSLHLHEKRLIGIVRAMIMEPPLIVYDSPFEGLSHEMGESILRLTTEFHSRIRERVSLYLSSDEESLKPVRADSLLRQEGRGFVWQ